MKKYAAILTIFYLPSLIAETKPCQIIEERLTESIAACLSDLESENAQVTGAVVSVKTPLVKKDGKTYLRRSEKEAEQYKDEIVENLKILASPDISIFADSKAEKNAVRYASLDFIVTKKLQPSPIKNDSESKRNGYRVQSSLGALHHDDGGSSLYRNVTISALKELKSYRLGIALESSSDDKNMDLLGVHLLFQRPFLIGTSGFSVIPCLFAGTLSTKDEASVDGGLFLSASYLFSNDVGLSLFAQRGRFTTSTGLGVDLAL